MKTDDKSQAYEYMWKQLDKFCLGPVPEKYGSQWFDENSKYCVYTIHILGYEPLTFFDARTSNIVVEHMLEAQVKIINQHEMNHRKDLTRLWGDRRHEFVLKSKGVNQKHDYDYIIIHKLSKQGVVTVGVLSEAERFELIKNMIDAGVEVIDETEL